MKSPVKNILFRTSLVVEWLRCRDSNAGVCCMLSHFSCIWIFATPWTVAYQAPLTMGFSRQEYWSGLLCPPAGDLPESGIKPMSLMSPTLAGRLFTTSIPSQGTRSHMLQLKIPYMAMKIPSTAHKKKKKKFSPAPPVLHFPYLFTKFSR